MKTAAEIHSFIAGVFPRFGINKIREVSRLVYEIQKRGNCEISSIIEPLKASRFEAVKSALLKLRYPESYANLSKSSAYLPELCIDPEERTEINKLTLEPEQIFFETSSKESPLLNRFKSLFLNTQFREIPSLRSFMKENPFSLRKFNKRSKQFIITTEKYDFFKSCPCTGSVTCCGYWVANFGFGCPYECTYCFLQGYQNVPGIIFPANIPEYLNRFKMPPGSSFFDHPRIGSGEFTDSLVYDNLTELSRTLVPFFASNPGVQFEFKTKSANINNLLSLDPASNVVISWSVNPKNIIDKNEFYTASLEERLDAAGRCAKHGYGIGFHFDPIIYYSGWENDYFGVVDSIFNNVPENSIKWISLGTLRMPAELKKVIESRFPENNILDGELLLETDNKLRYSENVRINIYRSMLKYIREHSSKPVVYLCMEPKEIWQRSGFKI